MENSRDFISKDSVDLASGGDSLFEFAPDKSDNQVVVVDDSWKVMVVDDDPEVHDVTKLVLADVSYNGKRLNLLTSVSCLDAKRQILENPDTALVLLDVVMEEDDSGLKFVKHVREELKNKEVRIVLRTGQPGQAPEERIIIEYDINDYKEKTELVAQKLVSTVIASLRTYQNLIDLKRVQQELIAANQRAEEMNALKDSFLNSMSHELRTPLHGIMGFADLLRDEIGDEELNSYVEAIQNSGERLMETLTDLLDLASLEAGEQYLEKRSIDVKEVCQGVYDRFLNLVKAKGLAFNLDLPESEVQFNLDYDILDKSIGHLLKNGIKFTHEGQITLQLEKSEKKGKNTIIISVSDSGIGIDPDFTKHMFDAFRQESTGMIREFEGNGLGLNITKRFVELMEGEILVESQKGVGTTFRLVFA